jgi:hypothetical protein
VKNGRRAKRVQREENIVGVQHESRWKDRGEGAGLVEAAGRAKSSENKALQGNSPTG